MTKDRIAALLEVHKGNKTNFISELEEEIQTDTEDEIAEALESAEWDEIEKEKVGVEYAVSQFADCLTVDDFREKYLEIQRRSFNFMV